MITAAMADRDGDKEQSRFDGSDENVMEAPPGFEPGMELLQGHPRVFCATADSHYRTLTDRLSVGCIDHQLAFGLGGVG
jgi:hypothetical protein